ncbi:MAG TPA: hypothetical protein VLW50_03625 [Streptosporangiaceae bacterium]|nr:hypothetical protein [Streptosporangiaceae bacterium]
MLAAALSFIVPFLSIAPFLSLAIYAMLVVVFAVAAARQTAIGMSGQDPRN